jgi:hypothetical protein
MHGKTTIKKLKRYLRNLTAYWGRLEKSDEKLQIWLESDKISGTLYECLSQLIALTGAQNVLQLHNRAEQPHCRVCTATVDKRMRHNVTSHADRPYCLLSSLENRLSGAAAKLRKVTIKCRLSVCLSVYPSVHPHGTIRLLHWWNFHEI